MSKTKTGANAQFTSAGKGLTVIGEHCYAYSGEISATTSVKTFLEFSTGKQMIIGTLQVNGPVDDDTATVGATSASQVFLNGIKLGILKTDTKDEDQPGSERWELLLPPLSTLKVTMVDDQNEADRYASMSFVGKIY